MSNAPKTSTANVVVSFLNRPVQEVIDFVKSKDKSNDAYLFRLANDNLLKFTHSYNFNKSDGDDIGNKITIEMIDLEGVFESTLYGNIGELRYSNDTLEKLRRDAFDDLTKRIKIKKALVELNSDFEDLNFKDQQTAPSWLTSLLNTSDDSAFKYGRTVEGSENLESTIKTKLIQNSVSDADLVAAEIIKKLNEKKLYKSEVVTKRAATGAVYNPYGGSQMGTPTSKITEKIMEKSVSSVFGDFNLDNIEPSTLPTPYFYFYYGTGDDPRNWSGPISSQITNARYNYSAENGKKSIELEFATTYNFPAFSKLALDKRGFMVNVPPKFRAAQIISPATNNEYSPTQATIDFKYTHECIKSVITDYIRAVTDPNINVLVLLPNLNSLVSEVLLNYYNAYETSTAGAPSFEVNALKVNEYAKFFQDLGFRTSINNLWDLKNIDKPVGSTNPNSITTTPITKNDLQKYLGTVIELDQDPTSIDIGTESQNVQRYREAASMVGPTFNTLILGLSLAKEKTETFKKPLERLIQGMTNKISSIQMCLEVIDNLQFVEEFKRYLTTNYPTDLSIQSFALNIDKTKPIVVFGDKYLIEKYLYGKKFYEIKQIIDSRISTKEKTSNLPLSFRSQVEKWAAESKNNDIYLTDFDNKIFNGNSYKYVTDIAARWFLRIDNHNILTKNSLYTPPQGEFELPPDAKKRLLDANIPIFKSGVTESNILSLDLNLNDYYFSMLRSVWQSKDTLNLVVDSNAQKVDQSQLTPFFSASSLGIVKFNIGVNNLSIAIPDSININDVFSVIDKDNKFKNLDPNQKSQAISSLILFLSQQLEQLRNISAISGKVSNPGGKISIIVASHENVNPYLQYLNMFTRVVNNSFIGYLKTLPYFHLTGTGGSLPPVILIVEEANLPPYDKKNFITRSFNGLWSILGYKHSISADDIVSEFWITKDIRLEIPLVVQPIQIKG